MSEKTIAIVLNSSWNIVNFRLGLIKALQATGNRIIVITPAGEEQDVIEATGAEFVPLNNLQRKGTSPLKDLRLVMELVSIYRLHQVDIALHYTVKPVIYGSLAARLTGVKSVNTVTGLGYAFLSRGMVNKVVRTLYRIALSGASFTLFHNADDRALFLEMGLCSASNTGTVPGSGINLAAFEASPFPVNGNQHFLFIGRLLSDKGVREYVAAAAIAKKQYPELMFHVVGGTEYAGPTGIAAAELASWRAAGTIIYHGTQADVRPFIAAAGVVVLPSYREGIPRVLLEAAAMARPAITTNVPGCREVVRAKENGWLVEVKDVNSLVAAIFAAVQTPRDQLIAMGEKGRQIVTAEFAEEIVVTAYQRLLRNLI